MESLKEYADFYVSKGIWVYPFNDTRESFNWTHWKGLSDANYLEEYNGYNWNSSKGINLVSGKNDICMLLFPRDTDERYSTKSIETLLKLLELPIDYEWVFIGNTYIALVIKIDGDIGNAYRIVYKEIKIYYKANFILPPGISSYMSYFKRGLPKKSPTKVLNTTFLKCLKELNNINLVDTGEEKRKAQQIKQGLKVGCGCSTMVAIIIMLAVLGVFDGEKLSFMETLLTFISMIALFAIGAYITKDT